MISQLANHKEVKEKLLELAEARVHTISGSDVISFLIRNKIGTNMGDINGS